MSAEKHPGSNGGRRLDPGTVARIDALLDGEGSRESMRDLYDSIRGDAAAREELARLRYTVAQLRTPPEVPDLTRSILHQADARRRFLPSRARRLVTVGRCAAALGVVASIGLMSFVQRHAPISSLTGEPRPVSHLVDSASGSRETAQAMVSDAVETLQASIASPVARLSLEPSFRPERQYRYDLAVVSPAGPAPRAAAVTVTHDPLAPRTAIIEMAPAPSHAGSASPFIGRFGSLLVVLREPPSLSDDGQSEGNDR